MSEQQNFGELLYSRHSILAAGMSSAAAFSCFSSHLIVESCWPGIEEEVGEIKFLIFACKGGRKTYRNRQAESFQCPYRKRKPAHEDTAVVELEMVE